MNIFFNITNKLFFFSILIIFIMMTEKATANDVRIQIAPTVVLVGEPAELRLSSHINYPSIKNFPKVKNLKWESTIPKQSSQIRIVNSRKTATYTSVYTFTVNKEGRYRVPSITAYLGHTGKKLPEVSFHANKHSISIGKGKKATIDDLLYALAVLHTDREYIYLGEEVPLDIKLYSLQGLNLTCSWPEILVDRIILRNYSKINPEAPNFMRPIRKSEVLDKQRFNIDIFKTAVRPISSGQFQGKIQIKCQLRISSRSSHRGMFDDLMPGFFGGSYKIINRNIVADLPTKKIKQLPPQPENSEFLGLVGKWNMDIKLDAKKLFTGDPATLNISIAGQGSLDTLTAPELKRPGFIIYPPEVSKSESQTGSASSAIIKYAVIPKEEGPVNLDLSFSIFQTNTEKYLVKKFNKKYIVGKGNNHTAVIDDAAENQTVDEMRKQTNMKNKSRQGILSLKSTANSASVLLPLFRNHSTAIYFFIFFGPLAFLIFEIFKRHHIKLQDNPELRRKKRAKRNKGRIKKLLAACKPESLNELVQNEITPFLNDLYGFPPGTSVNEIADKIKDADLAASLKAAGVQSYMPGSAHENPENVKIKLLNAMKKILIVIMTIASFSLFAAKNNDNSNFKLDSPESAYASGKYHKAEQLYRQMLKHKQNSPAVLYNIGNCLYKQGQLPMALVFYEQAHRLAPSDSDIIENLNLVRRKLMLPEIRKVSTPIDSLKNLRDSLRPDEWLLVAALLWSAIWLLLIFRHYISIPGNLTAVSATAIALILSLSAYFAQTHSTYSSKYALVVKKAPVYSLPTDVSQKTEFELSPGSEVRIEENRHGWKRIRNDESEGWVKDSVVKPFCPFK